MRKIDLSNYAIPEGVYDVKGSMQAPLYSPELRLDYRELFENDRVAQKINNANESVLLEEADYLVLKNAFISFRGYGKNEVELVRRVLEAPEVDIKEA
jgi:hypothetical protein